MKFRPLWLAQIIGDSKFDAAVERIVGRIETPLWDRIVDGHAVMSAFEARGYIRARSMILVADQLAREVSPQTPSSHIQRLRQNVLETLTSRMVRRLAAWETPQRLRQAA